MDDYDIIQELRHQLQDPEFHMRMDAVKQLSNIKSPATIPPLLEAFQSREKYIYQIAADALMMYGDKIVPDMLHLLDHTKTSIIARAVFVLGEQRHPDAIEPLIDLLKGDFTSWLVINEAIQALGKFRDPRALPVLESYLFNDRGNQTPHDVQKSALLAIDSIGTDQSLPIMLEFMNHPDPILRTEAIIAVGYSASPSEQIINALIESAKSSDGPVRRAAIEALGRLGEIAFKVLLQYLVSQDRKMAQVASYTLVGIGSPAIPTLKAAFYSGDYAISINAAIVISQMQQEQILIDGLYHKNEIVRQSALMALENIGTPTAREAIQNYLNNQS